MPYTPVATSATIAAVTNMFNAKVLGKRITADQIRVLQVRPVSNAVKGYNAIVTYRVTYNELVRDALGVPVDTNTVTVDKSMNITRIDIREALLDLVDQTGPLPRLMLATPVTVATVAQAFAELCDATFVASDFIVSALTSNTAIIQASPTNIAFTGQVQVAY